MKLETFFEKFEQLAAAPGAVAKMRELVMQLAAQGRLVPQDPNDEPVERLLARSLIERQKLKRTSATVVQPFAGEAALGYDIPISWRWQPLEELLTFGPTNGISPKAVDYETPVRSLALSATTSGRFKGEYSKFIATDVPPESDLWLRDGDVLVQRANTLEYVGVAAVYRGESNRFVYPDLMMKLRVSSAFDVGYIHLAMSQVASREFLRARASGTSGSMPKINQATLKSLPLPIPPLAEQRRIVAMVDKLMALCDRLEAQQQELETRHTALARASRVRFAEAPTPANLNLIFHKSYDIAPADLRKSILTLAVQGKLVPQDSKDEPAEDLIARLERARARFSKEQGIQMPKNVPSLMTDSYPHSIPKSWRWSRLGHLALVIDYGTSQKADSDSSKVPVYRMGNIVGGRLVDENLKYVDARIDDLPRLYLKTADILFNRTNSYELVGKVGLFKGRDDTATFASYLIRIRLPSTLLFPAFFSLSMNAPYFRQTQVEPEIVQQCGQANFNGTKLASTVVPIPPLAEQRRIAVKVDQLMALVDQLEKHLATSRITSEKLLDALVAELIAGA